MYDFLFFMSSCFDIKNACFTIEFSSFSHRHEKYFKGFFIRIIWIGNLHNSTVAHKGTAKVNFSTAKVNFSTAKINFSAAKINFFTVKLNFF